MKYIENGVMIKDEDAISRLESFRALKLSGFESFRALKLSNLGAFYDFIFKLISTCADCFS